MKRYFALAVLYLLAATGHSNAQSCAAPLPPATLIPHHLICVNFNTTTVLVFPAPVRPVDRGDRDILAQKQPGVENVLKLKAARKNFPVTNLHVFTADGRLYAFDVAYSDSLASTHDLASLLPETSAQPGNPVQLSQTPLNSEEMENDVATLKGLPSVHTGSVNRRDLMTFRLERIAMAGPLLLFRFRISNRSNLDYPLDFVRMYIRDRQKAKRTSVQEHEITPVFQDSASTIGGHASQTYVVAVPVFTLADGKQFLLEAYEKNGGRTLSLRVRNKTLFNARKL